MADVTIGAKLELDASAANQSVKSFKQQLKEAQNEVQVLSEKFGETSIQAQNAAKRAAELADKIGDAKKLVDAFNPDQKFRAFSQSLGGVLGGFSALTGAMGLLGVESEEVQKQLLKVQSALALSQGLNQLGESIASIKTLGSVLVQTLGKGGLIGISIAGVAALGLAIAGVFDGSKKLTDQQKTLNEVNKEAAKIYAHERAELDKNVESLKSENTSRADKKKIIDDLQKQYPNYFKDLDLEGDKVVGLTKGYNNLVKAIGLKARATAAGNLLAKQEEEILALGFEVGITTEEEALAFIEKLEKNEDAVSQLMVQNANQFIQRRKFLQGIVAESEKELKKLEGPTKTGGGGAGSGAAATAADLTTRISNQRIKTQEDELTSEERIQKKEGRINRFALRKINRAF